MTHVAVSDEVTPDAVALLWRTFFQSRNRGISPEFHFPWLRNKQGLKCIKIAESSRLGKILVASLILKRMDITPTRSIGLIGLVCVNENFRGQGLSTVLLRHAIQLGREMKFSNVVLWTSKPNVYVKHGFQVDCTDMFGKVSKNNSYTTEQQKLHRSSVVPFRQEVLNSTPAFAINSIRISNHSCSIVVCKSLTNDTIVEHTGSLADVTSLIDWAMPNEWYLNTPQHDPIIKHLALNDFDVALEPSSVRMNLALDTIGNHPLDSIPFLDRI